MCGFVLQSPQTFDHRLRVCTQACKCALAYMIVWSKYSSKTLLGAVRLKRGHKSDLVVPSLVNRSVLLPCSIGDSCLRRM